ncbi:hypothetical protein HPB49_001237 [Dermacentor silvarum]|uniref:Uncharacterized protein n=1 Tax=Dermacentor silvarum TaxID=543639 RepID=A0ACB8DT04_DERSI|nr:hypothetical protein HPB49_001237 [Dermacentor silvarum]
MCSTGAEQACRKGNYQRSSGHAVADGQPHTDQRGTLCPPPPLFPPPRFFFLFFFYCWLAGTAVSAIRASLLYGFFVNVAVSPWAMDGMEEWATATSSARATAEFWIFGSALRSMVCHFSVLMGFEGGLGHGYWLYQPASAVGGFQYPHSGHHGYHQPHGYPYAPGYQQGYPDGRYPVMPLPPPPPPPPPPPSLPYPGPWVPSYPRQPAPKNLDPFPGKFLGMGTVRYLNGGRDVELVCDLHGDQLVSVKTLALRLHFHP